MPLSPTPELSKHVMLVNKSQCLDEMQEEVLVVALVLSPTAKSADLKAPPAFTALLQEFRDVFLEELPTGLPPLRDRQHCIDFSPNSVLPNRPHYRISSRERDELWC